MSDDETPFDFSEWMAAETAQADQAVVGAANVARIISSFHARLGEEGFCEYHRLELSKTYLATMLGGGQS